MKNTVFKSITLFLILCSAPVGLAMDKNLSLVPAISATQVHQQPKQRNLQSALGARPADEAKLATPPAKKVKKSKNKEFLCEKPGCGRVLKTKDSLRQHTLIHEGLRPYACEVPGCGDRFRQIGHLRNHIRAHNNEKPFKCTYEDCTLEFVRQDDLDGHIKLIHLKQAINECSVCNKKFTRASNLKAHKRTHTGERPYSCRKPGCEKSFPRSDGRKAHEEKCRANDNNDDDIDDNEYNDKKSHKCTYDGCNKKYVSKYDLVSHIETLHLDNKDNQCPICLKTFTRNANLKTHWLTHTGEQSHECRYPQCDSRFARSDVRNRHEIKCPKRPFALSPEAAAELLAGLNHTSPSNNNNDDE